MREAVRVLRETQWNWRWQAVELPRQWAAGRVPFPRPTAISCGFCGGDRGLVVRGWQFHVRPGAPTIPYRCDVFVKCASCAAGWWHGVAVSEADWLTRPVHGGVIRRAIAALGPREPMLWNGARTRG